MSGSANEAGEGEGAAPAVEPVGPKQLREFDARVVQQLPDLSKEQMQHLIEHPDELSVRLLHYGLGVISQVYPAHFLEDHRNRNCIDSWGEFYAEEFQVDPDFSRIRLPDVPVFTYTTPIRVAVKVGLEAIANVIAKHGVYVYHWVGHDAARERRVGVHPSFLGAVEVGRSEGNYIASFSQEICEHDPRALKDEQRYRGTCMTLREYMLWVAYRLYVESAPGHKSGRSFHDDRNIAQILASCQGVFNLHGSVEARGRYSPRVSFKKSNDGHLELCIGTDVIQHTGSGTNYDFVKPTIRRVKLWKSLPQI